MNLEKTIKAIGLSVALALSTVPKDSYAYINYAKIGTPKVGYVEKVPDHNFRPVEIAPKESKFFDDNLIGRIQRTERWANIIKEAEKKGKVPENIVYAIIMNESYGDILQPNATGDGGIGLIHFQPGTARSYGLEIIGNSNRRGPDHKHGKDLSKMLDECKYHLGCTIEYDDRIHPVIIIDAIVRYLLDGYQRKKTWEGAIQTINPHHKGYAKKIMRYKNALPRLKPLAQADFNRRNNGKKDAMGHVITYKHYIETFWQTNEKNFELAKYREMKRW